MILRWGGLFSSSSFELLQRYLCLLFFSIGLCHGVVFWGRRCRGADCIRYGGPRPLEASLIWVFWRAHSWLPDSAGRLGCHWSSLAGLLLSLLFLSTHGCCFPGSGGAAAGASCAYFWLVPSWPFRSCKHIWLSGIHEAWHINSPLHLLVQL